MNTAPMLAISEKQIADLTGLSIPWFRKDRRGKRLIPYYRVGGRILYSPERVQAALVALEEGGSLPRAARKSRAVAASTSQ